MKEKLFYFLGQDGFLRMNTSVPEFTIFFRKETGFVNTMVVADLMENPFITKELVQSVRNKVRWKFIDQGVEDVHSIVLVISDDYEKALTLKDDNPFFWVIDNRTGELRIPDGCAEDYYGE